MRPASESAVAHANVRQCHMAGDGIRSNGMLELLGQSRRLLKTKASTARPATPIASHPERINRCRASGTHAPGPYVQSNQAATSWNAVVAVSFLAAAAKAARLAGVLRSLGAGTGKAVT